MKVSIGSSTVKGSNQNLGKKKSRKPKSKGFKSRRRRKSRRQDDSDFFESIILKESIIRKVTKMLGEASIEEPPEFEADANIFQDLDLLVLGSPPEEYKTYTKLLRKEYSHLDDANYKKMRLKILQTFLTIPTIYLTSEFQNRYEEAARTNINKEVEELKK